MDFKVIAAKAMLGIVGLMFAAAANELRRQGDTRSGFAMFAFAAMVMVSGVFL